MCNDRKQLSDPGPAETDAEYEARCALWNEHFKGSGWDRGTDETDAEYAERCAHLDGLFPPPLAP